MLKIAAPFDYQGKNPNFKRDTFETLSEMIAYPAESIDNGHVSYCTETGLRYEFIPSYTSSTSGHWRPIVDDTQSKENPINSTSQRPPSSKAVIEQINIATTESNTNLAKEVNTLNNTISTLDTKVTNYNTASTVSIAEVQTELDNFEEIAATGISQLETNKLDANTEINGHTLKNGDIDLTKADIGLGNVDNTSDLNKPISSATQTALNNKVDKVSGSSLMTTAEHTKLSDLYTRSALDTELTTIRNTETAHETNYLNPHKVTATQIGLGRVDNTSDMDKPISTATQSSLNTKVDKVSGSSLVSNTEISKLSDYPLYSNLITSISDKTLVSPTISGSWSSVSGTSGNIFEVGDTATFTGSFSWTHLDGYKDPTECSGNFGTTLPQSTVSSETVTLSCTSSTVYTATISAPKVGLQVVGTSVVPASGYDSKSDSVNAIFKNKYYYGTSESNSFTGSPYSHTFQGTGELTINLPISISNITTNTSEYFFLAYPLSFGTLTSIIQNDTIQILGAFSYSTIQIKNIIGTNVDYYLYITNNPGAFTGASLQFKK